VETEEWTSGREMLRTVSGVVITGFISGVNYSLDEGWPSMPRAMHSDRSGGFQPALQFKITAKSLSVKTVSAGHSVASSAHSLETLMKAAALTFFLCASAALLLAQPQEQGQPPEEDAPGRGVARISVMNGEVSVRRGDSGDVVAAAINAPLVIQDRILTGPASRAEVQFDSANMIRLGAHTEARLSELEYHRYQIQIPVGTTTFRVLRNSDAQVEISTPTVAVRPLRIGVYRVSVTEDGASEITVRSGEAEILTPRGSERLVAGKTMLARGTASDPEFQVVAAVGYDDWDRWNENRDRDLERSQSVGYVGSDVYGAEDLDGYGSWETVPTYGRVWRPTVAADWAPYRAGRWVWIDYYGWTWVSYDPWGWAPYHYGRWFYETRYGGWCWWPGSIYSRTYWRPALVAFFGWGNYGGFHAGIGFGYGNVGWVPLAPYEAFHPWYGRGYYGGYRGRGFGNTTIVNNTNITNIYRNARVMNGVTAVNAESFGRSRVGAGNMIRVNGSDLQRAGLVHGQLPLTPGRESLHMADRQVRLADMPRTAENRQFYSRMQSARVDRVPFEQQRQGMEQVARRTFGDGSTRGGEFAGRGSAASVGNRNAESQSIQSGGWRRAGESSVSNAPQQSRPSGGLRSEEPAVNRAPERSDQGGAGWHRFGEPAAHARGDAPGVSAVAPETNRSQRMEAPMGRGAAPPSGEAGNSNWRRFGDASGRPGSSSAGVAPEPYRGNGRYSQPAVERPPAQIRQDRPSSYQPFGGGSAGRSYEPPARQMGNFGRDRSEAVRISPPIVRERSMPQGSVSRGGGGSAPRSESRGGGGGGGSRNSGGGGGHNGGGRR
jgi:hypothetical protein